MGEGSTRERTTTAVRKSNGAVGGVGFDGATAASS